MAQTLSNCSGPVSGFLKQAPSGSPNSAAWIRTSRNETILPPAARTIRCDSRQALLVMSSGGVYDQGGIPYTVVTDGCRTKTPSGRKCYLCLRNNLLPMCPARTNEIWLPEDHSSKDSSFSAQSETTARAIARQIFCLPVALARRGAFLRSSSGVSRRGSSKRSISTYARL